MISGSHVIVYSRLGAVGRCPVYYTGFDASPQRVLPERCRQCGALLELRVA
jgi:hypothetical protein